MILLSYYNTLLYIYYIYNIIMIMRIWDQFSHLMLCDCSISRCFTLKSYFFMCVMCVNFCIRLSLSYRFSKVYNKLVNLFLYLLTFYSCFSPLRETVFYFSISSLYVRSGYPPRLYFFQLFLILPPPPSPLSLALFLSRLLEIKHVTGLDMLNFMSALNPRGFLMKFRHSWKLVHSYWKFSLICKWCIYFREIISYTLLFPHIFQNKFNIIVLRNYCYHLYSIIKAFFNNRTFIVKRQSQWKLLFLSAS